MILTEDIIKTLPIITEEELKESRYSQDEFMNEVLSEAETMLEEIERECGYDSSKQEFTGNIKEKKP